MAEAKKVEVGALKKLKKLEAKKKLAADLGLPPPTQELSEEMVEWLAANRLQSCAADIYLIAGS